MEDKVKVLSEMKVDKANALDEARQAKAAEEAKLADVRKQLADTQQSAESTSANFKDAETRFADKVAALGDQLAARDKEIDEAKRRLREVADRLDELGRGAAEGVATLETREAEAQYRMHHAAREVQAVVASACSEKVDSQGAFVKHLRKLIDGVKKTRAEHSAHSEELRGMKRNRMEVESKVQSEVEKALKEEEAEEKAVFSEVAGLRRELKELAGKINTLHQKKLQKVQIEAQLAELSQKTVELEMDHEQEMDEVTTALRKAQRKAAVREAEWEAQMADSLHEYQKLVDTELDLKQALDILDMQLVAEKEEKNLELAKAIADHESEKLRKLEQVEKTSKKQHQKLEKGCAHVVELIEERAAAEKELKELRQEYEEVRQALRATAVHLVMADPSGGHTVPVTPGKKPGTPAKKRKTG